MFSIRLRIIFLLSGYSALLLVSGFRLVCRGTLVASVVEARLMWRWQSDHMGYFMYGAFVGYGCIWCSKGGKFKSSSLVFCI